MIAKPLIKRMARKMPGKIGQVQKTSCSDTRKRQASRYD